MHQRDSGATTGPRKVARPGGNHAATNATGVPRWMQSRADGYEAAGPKAASVAAGPTQVSERDGAGPVAGDLVEQPLPSPPQGGGVRAKLEVGGIDDPQEHEADSLASAALDPGKALSTSGGSSPSFSGSDKVRRKPDVEGGGRPAGMEGFGSGIGRPLDGATRAFFEPRFGADLGAVRIHDDRSTRMLARSMGARAFTVGADIGFAEGELTPHTSDGRFLLAHELAHVSRGHGGVRRDIQDDLEGRPSVPAAAAPIRPPGTIRYQLPSGEQVYAPYGIYRPEQVPTWLHGLTMESSQALRHRYPDQFMSDIYEQALAGNIPNPNQVTIGDMVRYAEQQGPGYNLRLLIALVDGGYRFLGYDTSRVGGGVVYEGFIESNRATGVGRTGGVGQALFADRVTRTLASGASEMHLEVGLSEGTARFHEAIWRIAGISGTPADGEKYPLDTRQMVRIALAWSDVLSPPERQELVRFAVMQGNPSAAEVQAVLTRTAPSGGGAGIGPASPAAVPGRPEVPAGETMEMMQRFMTELRSNVRQPAEVESLRKLQEAETQDLVLREHSGFAVAEGRLYRLEPVGQAMRISEVIPEPIIQPVAEPLGPVVEPVGAAIPPRMLNLDPSRALRIGETVIPPSEGNPAELQEGELLVVGYERALLARDPVTQRPLLGVYEGGRWYMIVGENMRGLDFDPETGMRIETLQTEGGPVRAVELATDLPSQTALQRAPVSTVAVGGAGIIMVANDILKWIGAGLQVQRATIESGKAEFVLWTRLGAAPVPGIWDAKNMEPAKHGTDPDTSWVGMEWYFPYISDINADLLRAELPRRVKTYGELAVLLASMGQLHAFEEEPDGRMMAVVNRPQGAAHIRYDITEAIRTVEALTLASAESGLRERLALRPAAERQGRIRRVRPGATLLRSMGEGLFNTQPLIGAGDRLGPNAWVREIRRNIIGNKLFVEPVNADAHQAVALTAYVINQDLEDAWRECKKGGRDVYPAELPSFGEGPFTGFQAGPETKGDQRFGWTRYEKKPDNLAWTVAFGELRAFWVAADDTTVVTDDEIEAYLRK
jgi:Domain of unknown function (DUF4157)